MVLDSTISIYLLDAFPSSSLTFSIIFDVFEHLFKLYTQIVLKIFSGN